MGARDGRSHRSPPRLRRGCAASCAATSRESPPSNSWIAARSSTSVPSCGGSDPGRMEPSGSSASVPSPPGGSGVETTGSSPPPSIVRGPGHRRQIVRTYPMAGWARVAGEGRCGRCGQSLPPTVWVDTRKAYQPRPLVPFPVVVDVDANAPEIRRHAAHAASQAAGGIRPGLGLGDPLTDDRCQRGQQVRRGPRPRGAARHQGTDRAGDPIGLQDRLDRVTSVGAIGRGEGPLRPGAGSQAVAHRAKSAMRGCHAKRGLWEPPHPRRGGVEQGSEETPALGLKRGPQVCRRPTPTLGESAGGSGTARGRPDRAASRCPRSR